MITIFHHCHSIMLACNTATLCPKFKFSFHVSDRRFLQTYLGAILSRRSCLPRHPEIPAGIPDLAIASSLRSSYVWHSGPTRWKSISFTRSHGGHFAGLSGSFGFGCGTIMQ